MATITRFLPRPEGSFFLFGPRGTGKSTWLKQAFPDALYLDLLDPATFRSFSARPERLIELINGAAEQKDIIVDEVQKLPELLPVIHALIEEKRGIRFILTGSSSRKLKRTGADLLAGRAVLRSCHSFMAAEMGAAFSLEKSLVEGTLPLVFDAENPADTLAAYAALYLQEEVQAERMVRNIGDFSRFLESISFSHGSLLSLAEVARDCEVQRKTVEGYLSVLEDLLLSFCLPVFSKRAKRILVKHHKFYYFDAGVFRSLRPAGPLDRPAEIDGAALEGLVAQHLRAWNAYSKTNRDLFFWRTKGGTEVDFVVYGPDVFAAIEVKNSDKVTPNDVKSLRAFASDYPSASPILLYRGKERLKIRNILCVPCEGFLLSLQPDVIPEDIELRE